MAQGGDIAIKLIGGVLKTLAGKGYDSIFGTGPKPLTVHELSLALDKSLEKSFNSQYLKQVRDQITELRSRVREYRSVASVESRRNQIDAISGLADKIRGAIKNGIHDGQFFQLLPVFLMATNVWLAFQAELKFVTVNENASLAKRKASYKQSNHIVAREVLFALRMHHEFYYHDFINTGHRNCIYKDPGQFANDNFGTDRRWANPTADKVCYKPKYWEGVRMAARAERIDNSQKDWENARGLCSNGGPFACRRNRNFLANDQFLKKAQV